MYDLVSAVVGGTCGYLYVLQGQYGQTVTSQDC